MAGAGASATAGFAILSGGTGQDLAYGAVLRPGVTANLTVGFTATSYSLGNIVSSFTPDPALGNFQHGTNHGAFTINPPSSVCTIEIEMVNDGSAGAVTPSGWTKSDLTALTTTNGHKFILHIVKTNSYSRIIAEALQ
jgi:hypothetical protein